MAAMNVDSAANLKVKSVYNITGFPTLLYFKNGELVFPYGGEMNKDSLVEWMLNPTEPKEKEPEKSWADEEDVHVTFLTEETFDPFLETHKNVLVKFYAPCNNELDFNKLLKMKIKLHNKKLILINFSKGVDIARL
jgi:protein disulfide isomerase family A protein 5